MNVGAVRWIWKLAGFAGSVLLSLVNCQLLPAQVLITGENGGKGSRAAMISANTIHPAGFGTLTNAWVQYGYGATNRVDAFVSYGNITAFGKSQSYAAIGSNIGMLKRAAPDWISRSTPTQVSRSTTRSRVVLYCSDRHSLLAAR